MNSSLSKSLHAASPDDVSKALAELPPEERQKLQQALQMARPAATALLSASLSNPQMAERAVHEEADALGNKELTREERKERIENWLQKYAPDGPFIKDRLAFEEGMKDEYPSWDVEGEMKKHESFRAYFIDYAEWALEGIERDIELAALFKQFEESPEEVAAWKAKKEEMSGKRDDKAAMLAALRAAA
eukprot:symbB.v1.2.011802.t1/scaffold773.1/size166002/11